MPRITKFRFAAFSSLILFLAVFYFSLLPLRTSPPDSRNAQVLGTSEEKQTQSARGRTEAFWRFSPWEGKPLAPPPVVNASGAIAINLSKNKIFYEKNPHLRLLGASTIKIMTAIIALEYKKLEDIFIVSETAASQEPDIMGLFPGEKLTLKQLLQGVLLVSGNDASEAIAEGVAGSESAFVELMNQKAQELGLANTVFANPSGLEGGEQYTSVYDLALLSKYALKSEVFREIVASQEVLIPYTVDEKENHKNFYLANSSPLVSYPGFLGIKPGFTPQAKKCLVTLVNVEGQEILVVVLGSDDRKGDTESLLEYAKNTI